VKITIGYVGEDGKAREKQALDLKTWYVTTTDANAQALPYVGSMKVGLIQSVLLMNPDTDDAELIIYVKPEIEAEAAA
jgi:hypothetical protein